MTGDPRLLGLVMQNLLSNAWKFTSEQRDARIAVGMREHQGVPAYYVEDNGAGFDMDFADKLFDPFQRLHAAARFPGTGIRPTTIVERVVYTRHGGRVWAESAAGRGATFYFTLAPSHTPADDPPDANRRLAGSGGENSGGQPRSAAAGQRPFEHGRGSIGLRFPRQVRGDPIVPGLAQSAGQSVVSQKFVQRRGERFDVARRHQEPVAAMRHQ